MQALVVEFRIRPEFIAAFEAAIEENARLSRETEPGCRQFDVCRDAAEPALFFLYELYDDEAALQAHLESAHFRRLDATSAAWVAGKTVRRLIRTAP
jgi:(4S)-4-hydroxy-5-phosphonooxypentane-2,3-dione isomerase